MRIPIYKVAIQVGFQKAGVLGPRGQLIRAEFGHPNQEKWTEVRICEGDGARLDPKTKRPMVWWMSEQWLSQGDLIRVSTKVAQAGVGVDEDRTMDLLYQVDPSQSVVEVKWSGVGYKNYFLLKGCLRELARSSRAEQRQIKEIDPVTAEGFGEVRYAGACDLCGRHGVVALVEKKWRCEGCAPVENG